ncbi:MAG: SDR family NAD(P)-dependent oxidoreductase [Ignavibacteria bacterium]|nr:SDR family NAD(P)-dependent oxidoreductase [Ignavibacteria bacterium]
MSEKNTKDKVAIVTGGTGALGRVVAHKLAELGIKVYIPTLTMEEFNHVFDNSSSADEGEFKLRKIFAFDCNAFDENSVKDFVDSVEIQEKGSIDYLVNTVGGIHAPVNIADLDTAAFDKMFTFNFKSTFFFTRECLKIMKRNNFGRIISMGAIAGMKPEAARFPYSYSKAGVNWLMDTISEEYKDYNIRANTVMPSIIDTPANREWGSEEDIKKWVKPEEVADAISYLISDKGNSIRSSIIKVFGNY